MSESKDKNANIVHDVQSISDHANSTDAFDLGKEIDQYIYHDKSWWNYSHFLKLHWFIFVLTLSSTNNGYDGSMLNGLQSLSSWQDAMGHPTTYVLGALANGTIFGGVLCIPVAAWISDRWGRKFAIALGSTITVIGAVLQGASTDYAFFFVSRVIIGFGFGITSLSSPILIAEIAFPTYRPTSTAIYNVCWYLGATIAAWVTYGTRLITTSYSWRVPSYLQGLIPLFQVLVIWWVPESPRYLVSRGRIEDAKKFLFKHHTGNDTSERASKLVEFELLEIEQALELEKLNSQSKYTDFITIKSFRKRLFLLMFTAAMTQLSGNGLVSYYLNLVLNSIGITEEKKQLQINGCLMIYNLVISAVIAFTCYLFRRRTLFLVSIVCMLISYILWTILSAINQQRGFPESLGQGVLAMIFIYYLSYNTGLNGLPYLYVTEILPYTHRAKGLNIYGFTINVTLIYNGFVNPIAMANIEWKYYIVYCCFLAVELVTVYFTFVETYGYTLEEVAEVFGDESVHKHFNQQSYEKPSLEHVEYEKDTSV
ncbi:hexose transporter [Scheffersomyces xylosifermentans]|uniref:hexose transporter n=1 Tax=Scheffersomyces xylosifermentans TaxID=1304137 RepID=UPI00315CE6DF